MAQICSKLAGYHLLMSKQ